MSYQVIARKYRPQTFSEVAGQEAIARTLANAVARGRIPHGFLFTGPSGVGKTTMARIIAKALCCEQGPTPEPCGVCEECRMIAASSHPDVYEIDAATHNGVDDVRQLAERATYAPTRARAKIFILDEVHMLSASAWNALLKILEEPPDHVRFVFATTEIDKIPATVVNRTQRFDFRPIAIEQVVDCLTRICREEQVLCAEPLLWRIARAAGGGMREAQTTLDQLISMAATDEVQADDLDLLLGAARGEDLDRLLDALLAGRVSEALEILDRLAADGVAPAALTEQLTDRVRRLLLIAVCGAESAAVRRAGPVGGEDRDRAATAGQDRLLRMAQIFSGAQQSLRGSGDPRLLLELACVRIGQVGQIDVEGMLRRFERLEKSLASRPGPR